MTFNIIKEKLLVNKFIRFSIIGAFGYLIDISIFFILIELFDVSAYIGRFFSVFIAASLTWLGNRLYTFSSTKKSSVIREWFDYLYSMIPGAAVNYSVFSLIVYSFENTRVILFFAFSIGVLVGLAINYNIARNFVFK